MTEEEHTLTLQHSYAIGAKHRVTEFADMLSDEDKADIVNALVTFENSHIIANSFKDDKTVMALYEELLVCLRNQGLVDV